MQVESNPAAVPALYAAVVAHTRHTGPSRSFRHRLYLWLVDLDALPQLPRWLRPFARFDPRDHLGSPARTIRQNLGDWLAEHGIDLAGGRVLMLAHARVLGYVFNPLSVFWCHRADGELACVVAEVHNTYGERHCYLLHPDAEGYAAADKQFYVSPFLPEEGGYRMKLPVPAERLQVRVQLRDREQPLLTAAVTGRRFAVTPRRLLALLLRWPLAPQRVSMGIRRHGIALWLRRAPFFRHPERASRGGFR
ncbi:DUF1365 domain-containing protein [Amycolatopsis aidingensis]|uniref:DUF1365 domain-containing protein n=1 Tax=Amycolatopsis aidingensis TaxID=2842453 RepID=UPI001C0BD42E|nr:DUF1365 domain-containing protein [Amycolatopsis aidingensis]